MKTKEPRVIGQTSAEVTELVTRLAQVEVGETVSYRELSKLVGVDVVVRRHLLESARRIAMREHRIVFGVVMNQGLRRLDSVEVVEIEPESRRKRIRTQARLGMRALTTVDYEQLPDDKKVQQNVGLAMLGGVLVGSEKAAIKQLTEKVKNGEVPDISGTLKLIGWTSD